MRIDGAAVEARFGWILTFGLLLASVERECDKQENALLTIC
jgi:hypothetical protein